MLPRLIALCGAARHGKSTVADYLVEHHDYKKLGFSGPLKEMIIKALSDCPPCFYIEALSAADRLEFITDTEKFWRDKMYTNRDEFSRWLMQFVGTDIMRAYDPECWVKLWRADVYAAFDGGHKVVTEDARFLNEALATREMGGEVWRVIRMDADAPMVETGAEHQSEQEYLRIIPDRVLEAPTGVTHLLDAAKNLLTARYGCR